MFAGTDALLVLLRGSPLWFVPVFAPLIVTMFRPLCARNLRAFRALASRVTAPGQDVKAAST
jgi:hypothetical protein